MTAVGVSRPTSEDNGLPEDQLPPSSFVHLLEEIRHTVVVEVLRRM
jgi:hypothetical protein